MEQIFLNDRKYIIYPCEKPEKIIFLMLDKRDEELADIIYNNVCQKYESNNTDITNKVKKSIMLVACTVNEWNKELSPWKAPAVFGTDDFKGEGLATLKILTDSVTPYLTKTYNINMATCNLFICGYSLAGLFSLWAIYNTDIFSGAICCSGSLWFQGFEEYIKNNKLCKDCCLYLSLGDTEHKTRNPIMSTVKTITEQVYDFYQNTPQVRNIKLEWNKGNHFNHPEERLQKGILWLLETC